MNIIPLNTSVGVIALVCIAIVFLILFFLVTFYILMPRALDAYFSRSEKIKESLKKGSASAKKVSTTADTKTTVEANVSAAIAMALHLYTNSLHDEESNVITIDDVKKAYSPWSSKIYSVMNNPKR